MVPGDGKFTIKYQIDGPKFCICGIIGSDRISLGLNQIDDADDVFAWITPRVALGVQQANDAPTEPRLFF